MGPVILLDKSTLELFSLGGARLLGQFYCVNIPPILIWEILGDLKKFEDDDVKSRAKVKELANKVLVSNSWINFHHERIIEHNLLGDYVMMTGGPVVAAEVNGFTSIGERMVGYKESAEERALKKWRKGVFSEYDAESAQKWRRETGQPVLERFAGHLRQLGKLPDVRTLDDLIDAINLVIDELVEDRENIRIWMDDMAISKAVQNRVFDKWEREGLLPFRDFAPYAYYCFRVKTAFCFALPHNLASTGRHTRADLEYLYYLPFCQVFSSEDHFHATFCKRFLRPDQDFVSGRELKVDLDSIQSYHEGLPASVLRLGVSLPENPASFTYKAYCRHLPRQKPMDSGDSGSGSEDAVLNP